MSWPSPTASTTSSDQSAASRATASPPGSGWSMPAPGTTRNSVPAGSAARRPSASDTGVTRTWIGPQGPLTWALSSANGPISAMRRSPGASGSTPPSFFSSTTLRRPASLASAR